MESKKSNSNIVYYIVGIIILTAVSFCLGYRLGYTGLTGTFDLAYWGTAIGGFLAVPTLIMLFVAFFIQRKELKTTVEALNLQKEESNTNREALEAQRDEVIESRKALEIQKIDSAFFSMLNMLDQIVNSMVFKLVDNFPVFRDGQEDKVYVFKGRDYLSKALSMLHEKHNAATCISFNAVDGTFVEAYNKPMITSDEFSETTPTGKVYSREEVHEQITGIYEEFYQDHQSNLGRYFRYVYNIMKFIIDCRKDSKISSREVIKYMQILQAQLSNDEMGLLFYNASFSRHGRTKSGKERFKTWLDNYNILENIDESCLIEKDHHWFYKTEFKFLETEERKFKSDYSSKKV